MSCCAPAAPLVRGATGSLAITRTACAALFPRRPAGSIRGRAIIASTIRQGRCHMPECVPTGRAPIWAGICGLLGTCMLIASFAANTGPPAGDAGAQLTAFEQQHLDAIPVGRPAAGRRSGIHRGVRVHHRPGGRRHDTCRRLDGHFRCRTLMTVSLVEVVFYIGALHTSPATTAEIGFAFLRADQHLYFIVAAPALFAPLGLVILGSEVLPRVLGYLALVLAAGYALAGIVTMTDLTFPVAVQISASVQVLWWLAAGITFIVQARQASSAIMPVGAAAGHPPP